MTRMFRTRFLAVVMFAAALALAASSGATETAGMRLLSLDERIAAQRSIERVYFEHLDGTRLRFDDAVTREFLEEKVVASYINWATTVLRPWIESDEDLKKSLQLLRDSKDMVGEDFLHWLRPHLPIL